MPCATSLRSSMARAATMAEAPTKVQNHVSEEKWIKRGENKAEKKKKMKSECDRIRHGV